MALSSKVIHTEESVETATSVAFAKLLALWHPSGIGEGFHNHKLFFQMSGGGGQVPENWMYKSFCSYCFKYSQLRKMSLYNMLCYSAVSSHKNKFSILKSNNLYYPVGKFHVCTVSMQSSNTVHFFHSHWAGLSCSAFPKHGRKLHGPIFINSLPSKEKV